MYELETERLNLRPLAVADAEALHCLWTSVGVRQFLWDGEVVARERTNEVVRGSLELFGNHGFGIWGAWPQYPGALVGFGGFWHFREPTQIELLFGVGEEAWGRGLGTEIAGAITRYGFERLGFDRIRASTDAGNVRSTRVLEKLGFRLVRRAVVGELDTLFYEIEKGAV